MRGRYEVAAELARGGMAVLHIARARGPAGFEKHVVLKRIAPQWADDHEFVEMFLNEARLAAALEHPHVVTVYDLGQDEDGPYFVMEYIHGVDVFALLRECAKQGESIPLQHALTIGIAVAGGLHHAHGRGIVHRDVSPRNIIVSYDGGVKVVDFGIAKAISKRTQTRPSVRKGKVGYMSPEQCRGEQVTAASDVYALGVVLHELFTGRRLFRGDDEFAIMNAIVNRDAEPPSELRSDLPPVLDRLVLHALARRPADRIASARELQAALEDAAAKLRITPSLAALGDYVGEVCGQRPHPWDSSVDAASEESVDPRDRIATRAEAAPRTDPPAARARSRWLVGLGAAAIVAAGVAVWTASGGPERGVDPAEIPSEATPRRASAEREVEVAEPIQSQAPTKPPTQSQPQPQAQPPTPAPTPEPNAATPDPSPAPADDPPRRDGRRPKAKTKAKRSKDTSAEPFDPDGLGPLPTLLDP